MTKVPVAKGYTPHGPPGIMGRAECAVGHPAATPARRPTQGRDRSSNPVRRPAGGAATLVPGRPDPSRENRAFERLRNYCRRTGRGALFLPVGAVPDDPEAPYPSRTLFLNREPWPTHPPSRRYKRPRPPGLSSISDRRRKKGPPSTSPTTTERRSTPAPRERRELSRHGKRSDELEGGGLHASSAFGPSPASVNRVEGSPCRPGVRAATRRADGARRADTPRETGLPSGVSSCLGGRSVLGFVSCGQNHAVQRFSMPGSTRPSFDDGGRCWFDRSPLAASRFWLGGLVRRVAGFRRGASREERLRASGTAPGSRQHAIAGGCCWRRAGLSDG